MKHKPPKDARGGHIRLYWEILDSPAWRSLTASDQRCYVALLRNLRSLNNGDLSLALSVAKHHGIKSQTTLAKGLRALQAVGLVAVTRRGGCKAGGQRLPTLYRITDQQCFDIPAKFVQACKASNEWKEVSSIAQGRALIRKADECAKAEAVTARKAAEAESAAIVARVIGVSRAAKQKA